MRLTGGPPFPTQHSGDGHSESEFNHSTFIRKGGILPMERTLSRGYDNTTNPEHSREHCFELTLCFPDLGHHRCHAAPVSAARFRGGLVFKAHRLCVSLNSWLERNTEEEKTARLCHVKGACCRLSLVAGVQGCFAHQQPRPPSTLL